MSNKNLLVFDGTNGLVCIDGSKLAFTKFGNGPQNLIAFHGFGLTKESFLAILPKLGNEYTIYSFDLFFHGSSTWKHQDQPISKRQLREFFDSFLSNLEIENFSLIAYSLGGKFAMSISEIYQDKIDKIYLIAPDGLVLSNWYKFATSFKVSRGILKWIVFKPKLYYWVTNILNKAHLVPNSTIRFAELNMKKTSQRLKVYKSWVVFRMLKVNQSQWISMVNNYNIYVEIHLGDKDLIIPREKIITLSTKIKNKTTITHPCTHSKVLEVFSNT